MTEMPSGLPSVLGEMVHQTFVQASAMGFGSYMVGGLVAAQEKITGAKVAREKALRRCRGQLSGGAKRRLPTAAKSRSPEEASSAAQRCGRREASEDTMLGTISPGVGYCKAARWRRRSPAPAPRRPVPAQPRLCAGEADQARANLRRERPIRRLRPG